MSRGHGRRRGSDAFNDGELRAELDLMRQQLSPEAALVLTWAVRLLREGSDLTAVHLADSTGLPLDELGRAWAEIAQKAEDRGLDTYLD